MSHSPTVLNSGNVQERETALAQLNNVLNSLKRGKEKVGKTALLIIDVQSDFCPPEGSLAVDGALEALKIINELRRRANFDVFVLTQDWHPPNHVSFYSNHRDEPGAALFQPHRLESGEMQMMWPDHCVQESWGSQFHPDLIVLDTDKVVRKGMNAMVDSYSGFFDNDHKVKTEMDDFLKQQGVTDVYLCGVATDYCVGFSALDSIFCQFRTYLIEDACRGVAPNTVEEMMARVREAGVTVIQSTDLLSK
eukprot:TRINITY_DN11491_c0_g1_i2.p1 TRINITY_DN11491_c0_g1~~TRINITY_DN11491_c0_g1_i2.p1  ORF type:complete len:274 (-),score=79.23 TRINITY_DN11491_c0_g1_i2:84-833(-)